MAYAEKQRRHSSLCHASQQHSQPRRPLFCNLHCNHLQGAAPSAVTHPQVSIHQSAITPEIQTPHRCSQTKQRKKEKKPTGNILTTALCGGRRDEGGDDGVQMSSPWPLPTPHPPPTPPLVPFRESVSWSGPGLGQAEDSVYL